MDKIKKIFIALLLMFVLAGCSLVYKTPEGLIKRETKDSEDVDKSSASLDEDEAFEEDESTKETIKVSNYQNISIYYWDKENNRLVSETHSILAPNLEALVKNIMIALSQEPDSESLSSVLPPALKVHRVEKTDNILELDISARFLEVEDLLVARTALVNTLTDREEINYVKLSIDGNELSSDGTSEGYPIGILSKTTNNLNELLALQNGDSGDNPTRDIDVELFFRDFRGQFLLSEIRKISIKNGEIERAVALELIKGPLEEDAGFYPVIPQGTKLLDAEITEIGDRQILDLYFSKEFKAPFLGLEDNQKDSGGLLADVKENIILSALAYNFDGLGNIDGVKIYYENEKGDFVDKPLYKVNLETPLNKSRFSNKLGKKIRIYYADSSLNHLKADYRAVSRESEDIASCIIDELIQGPRDGSDHEAILTSSIKKGDIKVSMDQNASRVIVDLPKNIDDDEMGRSGALIGVYAIVNSLTDPMNTSTIKEVQFLIDGQRVKTFGNLEFYEPFIRNPAIIKD